MLETRSDGPRTEVKRCGRPQYSGPLTQARLQAVTSEPASHLARIVAAEAAANGVLRVLDVVTGLGFTSSTWLAVLPIDVLVKALRLVVRTAPRTTKNMTPMSGLPANTNEQTRHPRHRTLGGLFAVVATAGPTRGPSTPRSRIPTTAPTRVGWRPPRTRATKKAMSPRRTPSGTPDRPRERRPSRARRHRARLPHTLRSVALFDNLTNAQLVGRKVNRVPAAPRLRPPHPDVDVGGRRPTAAPSNGRTATPSVPQQVDREDEQDEGGGEPDERQSGR